MEKQSKITTDVSNFLNDANVPSHLTQMPSARLIASKETKAYDVSHSSMSATIYFSSLWFHVSSLRETRRTWRGQVPRRRVPRDDRVSTELLYLVDRRGGVLFARQATSAFAWYSRIQTEDTNLEACRHLGCIERVRRRHH